MPELPEVETIKLGLSSKIVGLIIKEVDVRSVKSFLNGKGKPFDPSTTSTALSTGSLRAQGLRGRKVLKIWRKGKYLGIDLNQNLTLLIHLKMTGQLIYEGAGRFIGGHPTEDMVGPMPNSHTRVVFSFSDGSHLYFNDQRRFGWIRVIESTELRVGSGNLLGNLGPEPLEKGFTWQILKQNLLRHKFMPVKVAIMDQKVVSGVGNIYANEACFNAKIDPKIKVVDLTDKQFKALYHGVVKSLKDGIEHGGSTRAHFVDAEGHKGYFLDYAYVYGRDKHPCKVCGTEIKKVQLGGRGTYLCPKCQKI